MSICLIASSSSATQSDGKQSGCVHALTHKIIFIFYIRTPSTLASNEINTSIWCSGWVFGKILAMQAQAHIPAHTRALIYAACVQCTLCVQRGERVMLIHLYLSFMRFVVDVDEKISRIYLILIGVMRRKGERESERCINRVGKQRVKMSAFETCLKRPKAIAYAHT